MTKAKLRCTEYTDELICAQSKVKKDPYALSEIQNIKKHSSFFCGLCVGRHSGSTMQQDITRDGWL